MNTKVLLLFPLAALALSSISCSANAVRIIDEDNRKAVGHAMWHKQAKVDPLDLINQQIPKDSVSIFFIRANDSDPEQTSANIAVNDRFQVSLQPGSYTQVYSCAGINRLSAEVTGNKTNNLLLNTSDFDLSPNSNNFFYVDVDEKGRSTIQKLTEDSALDQLNGKLYQAHQITRVTPNCPVIVRAPTPVVMIPVPVVVPVLKEKVSIELEVLFDNDKSNIKPEYYKEVEEVATFMSKYSNTNAVIEGHTDSNASDSYNQKLSQRRADAVKDMMTSRFGISPDRLTAVGYGESRPRATNATAEGRQLNRRVVAVIEERR
ncbi:OmpA family protein [Psychrobacter sp. DAB_AL43B]|uniref:OmpA family protein n=1 Tax=Psychrobacter sp. DAB_AL43B TaxID=1028416 RepID=UPI0009A87F81|nr:OmpA family protein [Psychrobacter sp. DAB_AL43B]SLJ84795.1 Outer membrane porin F [Psychrobacter sp. DAB_AL43B]